MSRRFKIFAGLATLLVVMASCTSNTYEWNERVSLEIVTPDGRLIATSTYHVVQTYSEDGNFAASNSHSTDVVGETVAIRLPSGRVLIADLPGSTNPRAMYAFLNIGSSTAAKLDAFATQTHGPAVLKPRYYPDFFMMSSSPEGLIFERLSSDVVLGELEPGVRLDRITIEVTDDPISEGQLEVTVPGLFTAEALVCNSNPCEPKERWPRFIQ